MFHTTLCEISGGSTATGKKVGAKGGANAMRNNYEFQKLLRDVEVEMNSIRIGKSGKTKADRHPKMNKTLELVGLFLEFYFVLSLTFRRSYWSTFRKLQRMKRYMGRRTIQGRWCSARSGIAYSRWSYVCFRHFDRR